LTIMAAHDLDLRALESFRKQPITETRRHCVALANRRRLDDATLCNESYLAPVDYHLLALHVALVS
jgi:hypothetical protein